jgi:PKD repeat protein
MKNDQAINEIIGSVLIVILVIAAAAIVASLFLGLIDLTPKSAFIAPDITSQNISGKNIIKLFNKGGDTATLNVSGQGQYVMGVYVDSSAGSTRAIPLSSTTQFRPGDTLYVFKTASGFYITNNLSEIISPAVGQFPSGEITIRLVDENSHLLIATWSTSIGGSQPVPLPVSNFIGTPLIGNVPLTVQFNDTSTSAPTAWSWNFGDGGTSSQQNPIHTYASPGTCTVSLKVSNTGGNDTNTKAGYVTATAPVKAAFSWSPQSGDIPFTVQFTDHSTGPVTSWSWVFHDEGTSTQQNPSFTFRRVGWKNVTLTVTNASGGSNTLAYLTGHGPFATANAPVKAGFTATPTSGKKPLTVQFTDESTGPVNWWRWQFGSGSNNTEQNPQKIYQNAGTYTVTLTVRNSTGSDTFTRTNYITVTA